MKGWAGLVALLLLGAAPGRAAAFEADEAFAKGTTLFSLQVGGGAQANLEHQHSVSGITFLGFTPRLSYLPFEPVGSDWYQVAVEPGLEGWFQYYLDPQRAAAGGLKAALRLHALGFRRLVPYLEATAGAGGTSLDVPESRSVFTFVLEAGAGLSLFLARDLAITAGYRLQHFSNGNTASPNRGYEAHSGVIGVSSFFH
jgi:opacity protein-like surface antigen